MNKIIFTITALIVSQIMVFSQVNLEWERTYRGPVNWDLPGKIASDNSGNIIVTGSSRNNNNVQEYATIKYTPQGDTVWIQRRTSGGPAYAQPGIGLEIDNFGNIYIINSGGELIKYDSAGNFQWSRILNINFMHTYSIKIDPAGNPVVAGSLNQLSAERILAFSYSPSGDLRWTLIYGTAAGSIKSLDIDGSGSIYMTGYLNSDIITMMADTLGNVVWTNTYNGVQNGEDFGVDIDADNSGNVYVLGWAHDSSAQYENIITIKYNHNGTVQWKRLAVSPIPGQRLAYDLVVDNNSSVIIAGNKHVPGGSETINIIKYNTNGALQWEYNYLIEHHVPLPRAIVCDQFNNIYFTAFDFLHPAWGNEDPKILTVKLNSHGVEQWRKLYETEVDTIQYSLIERNRIVISGSSAYVLDGFGSYSVMSGYRTLKYTEECHTVTGQVTYKDNNQPVAPGGHVVAFYYDNSSSSIVVVDSATIQQNGMYTLTKIPQDTLDLMFYQNDDLLQYVPTYYESTIDWREATHIYATKDLTGIDCQVYRINNTANPFTISGQTFHNSQQGPTVPLKDVIIYAKTGDEFRNFAFSGTTGNYTVTKLPSGSYSLIASRYGFAPVMQDITVNGSSISGINFNFGSPIGIEPVSSNIPSRYSLSQNYPNPFNPATTIKFAIPKAGNVKLIIYDITGREIYNLLNENLSAGEYKAEWDASAFASGVYFYRIITPDFSDTKKMILVK